MTDAEAREILLEEWTRKHGAPSSESALRVALAIACHESGGSYGQGPTKAWGTVVDDFHNNWASVQAPKAEQNPCVPPNFLFTDSRPPKPGEKGDPKYGGNVTFSVCMKGSETPEDGCARFFEQVDGSKPWQRVKTWAAIKTGSPKAVATAMYDERYYGGFGKTREERIAGYEKALRARLAQFLRTLPEPDGLSVPNDLPNQGQILLYMGEVDRDYDALTQAMADAISGIQAPKPAATRYVVSWNVPFLSWKTFHAEEADDWIITTSDYVSTLDYHKVLLEKARGFRSALGKDPPPILPLPAWGKGGAFDVPRLEVGGGVSPVVIALAVGASVAAIAIVASRVSDYNEAVSSRGGRPPAKR